MGKASLHATPQPPRRPPDLLAAFLGIRKVAMGSSCAAGGATPAQRWLLGVGCPREDKVGRRCGYERTGCRRLRKSEGNVRENGDVCDR